MIDQLKSRHAAVAAAGGGDAAAEMAVVFDAGQNSQHNFDHLAELELHCVGSMPLSDVSDLLALPADQREIVDADRFEGLTALQARSSRRTGPASHCTARPGSAPSGVRERIGQHHGVWRDTVLLERRRAP